MTRAGRPPIPIADRFWSKVDKSTSCWLWTSNRHHNGYGQIAQSRNGSAKQRWLWAHRVSWELTHGAIPADLFVLHRCDTPLCVNPDHLFLGTKQDNIDDSVQKGRYTAWRKSGVRLDGSVAKPSSGGRLGPGRRFYAIQPLAEGGEQLNQRHDEARRPEGDLLGAGASPCHSQER